MQERYNCQNKKMVVWKWCLLAGALCAMNGLPLTCSFVPGQPLMHHRYTNTREELVTLHESKETSKEEAADNPSPKKFDKKYDPEEEVKRRLVRAKEVLAKSQVKLDAKEKQKTNGADAADNKEAEKEPASAVPFFAAKKKVKDPKRRESVIKATNEKTGLVQADGEKMAAMSETEEWEFRSLLEVFENELDEDSDVYSEASKQLRERDVAASIWNLRQKMKTEDYMRIFDKRNFFIGEDN